MPSKQFCTKRMYCGKFLILTLGEKWEAKRSSGSCRLPKVLKKEKKEREVHPSQVFA